MPPFDDARGLCTVAAVPVQSGSESGGPDSTNEIWNNIILLLLCWNGLCKLPEGHALFLPRSSSDPDCANFPVDLDVLQFRRDDKHIIMLSLVGSRLIEGSAILFPQCTSFSALKKQYFPEYHV